MAVVFESLIMDICLIPTCLILTICIHYYKCFSYWKLQNVTCIPPKFPFGNFDLLAQEKRAFGESVFEIYKLSKLLKAKYIGLYIFTKPLLLLIDPDLIGKVLKEDDTHFQDYVEDQTDYTSKHVKIISTNVIKTFKDTNQNDMYASLIDNMKMMIAKRFCTILDITKPPIDERSPQECYLENKFKFDDFKSEFSTAFCAINNCIMELSQNQEIQNKLRDEILGVLRKNHNVIGLNTVGSMKYLEQIVKETLRKYPLMPVIKRECKKSFKLPDTNVTIARGVLVWIPILGLHNDPLYYPEPEVFNPDRFTRDEELKRKLNTYFPFGNEIVYDI